MKFLDEHHLAITLLTPVHIGCGEDYTPTDYVIDDDALFAFDSAGIINAFSETARIQLSRLVSGAVKPDALINIQKLFYEQREALIAKASHYLPVADGIIELYRKSIGKAAQLESKGKRVANRLEMERTFYNPVDQKPVIPGSSLKGAIRTALLNSINQGNPLRLNEKNRKLQGRLFQYDKFENDPMRLVHLADTTHDSDDIVHTEIRFATNHPRQEPKRPRGKQTQAEAKGPYQLLEILSGFGPRQYRSRLTVHSVEQIRQNHSLPKVELRWTIKQIVQACNDFYLPLLEQELKIIKERRYASPDWEQQMDDLLPKIRPVLKSNQAMVLRIGRHSGAEAVTLNGVRSIKIMQGREKPKFKDKPQTLWLAANAQDARAQMLPFGWILVEINPAETVPAALRNFAGKTSDSKQNWLKKQQCRIADLQDKITRKEQQAQAEQQAEIDRQRVDAEKQARLASMSNEKRAIEELREQFTKAQASQTLTAQSVVPDELAKLLKQASQWPERERTALCDLAEEIYKPLGMLRGKKGKNRKTIIQQLKGLS